MRIATAMALGSLVVALPTVSEATTRPKLLEGVAFEQRLGAELPMEARFRDESGSDVRFGDLFADGKPVILTFAYADCPMLCPAVLQGVAQSLTTMSWTIGEEFRVVTVAIDPKDTPEKAAAMQARALRQYGREVSRGSWRFLVGDEPSIREVAKAAGFHYAADEKNQQYAHAAGLAVVTPDGRLSKYFYGFEFAPRDLRLALVEATDRTIGSLTDQILLLCFHWDPSTGKYSAATLGAVRAGGAATLLGLGGFLFVMWRRESRS